MNVGKRMLALLTGGLLLMGLLTGCGGRNSVEADKLVKGNLDLIYLHSYTESYLEAVGMTPEEAYDQYDEGIAVETQYFCSCFDIDLDLCQEGTEEEISSMFRKIYTHSKYEVGSVTRDGEDYLVEVTIWPMDLFVKVLEEDTDAFYADLDRRSQAGEFNDMTDEEYEQVWCDSVLELVSARAEDIGYLDPEEFTLRVTQEDGYYTVDREDFQAADARILPYEADPS